MGYSIYIKLHSVASIPEEQEQIGRAIQVMVLNGTEVQGLAIKVGDYLRKKNYDVVYTGNYEVKNVKNTFVIDHLGNKRILRKVLRILNISEDFVKEDINENLLQDYTIVIGEDYRKLKIEN